MQERDWNSLALVMRTSVPPLSVAQAAAAAVRALDPNQPVEEIRTMQDVIDQTLVAQRFSALVLAVFWALALTLASVGIYSVLSYFVRGRSRKLGIRTALAAQTGDVIRLVLRERRPAGIGIAAGGTLAALASAKSLERLVFGVSASDAITLAVVAATLAIVALCASLVPAWRASRVDSVTVLRGT
jgi:ABC-type antimicrobial peptide transport system permease subunit